MGSWVWLSEIFKGVFSWSFDFDKGWLILIVEVGSSEIDEKVLEWNLKMNILIVKKSPLDKKVLENLDLIYLDLE